MGDIQGNYSYDSAGIPLKRKRGRPRKDESLYLAPSIRPRTQKNLLRTGNVTVPEHVNPVEDACSKVGQAVKCVVESVFDAGYVITGKIGNSDMTLRGIILKPGHYAPVTAENDVAPHLPTVRGKETPPQSHTRQRSHKGRHQGSVDYPGNGSSTANLSSRRDLTATVAAPSVPSVGARGTIVPVVLEPGNAVAAQAALRAAASKGKNVQTVTAPSTYKLKLPAPHLSVPNKLPSDAKRCEE